ncbi:MAG: leucyl/phenylalanyl-tRNA--protein transferase [Pirellulales bacterium]|nr:leucyl/phenylalanyl-tRNA--protein transferase [Pirellulales bacterium]
MSLSDPKYFPPVATSTAEGLLAVGGELSVEWLLDAYRHGIFPWPYDERILAWWSPDPRAVIEFDRFHISRSLRRTLRQRRLVVTSDQAFGEVMLGCATECGRRGATWLTPAMRRAYQQLHAAGQAHSVEVWSEGRLAGGTYGVSIGGAFSAESMFYRVRDASKVALAHLVGHLRRRGYRLLDIQQLTPHTARLGAHEIPRAEYLRRLAEAQRLRPSWEPFDPDAEP